MFVDQKLVQPHPMTERLLEVDVHFELWVNQLESFVSMDKEITPTKSSKKRPEKEVENEVHQA